MIGYISLNMVKSQFTNTWQVNIEPEHSFQRRWRELAAIKLVFFKWFGLYCNTDCWFYCSNDCYWFEDLSVSKASKAESAIPPVNWWEGIDPQFQYFPEVSFQMWKSGISNVGLRIRSVSNLIEQMKKIHQLWVSISFLTCALELVRFPCRQHSRWAEKARLIRFWCR